MVTITCLRPSIHNYYNYWQRRAMHGQGSIGKFASSRKNSSIIIINDGTNFQCVIHRVWTNGGAFVMIEFGRGYMLNDDVLQFILCFAHNVVPYTCKQRSYYQCCSIHPILELCCLWTFDHSHQYTAKWYPTVHQTATQHDCDIDGTGILDQLLNYINSCYRCNNHLLTLTSQ